MFELKRKAVHFLGLSVPVFYWVYSRDATLVLVGIALLCGVFIEVVRLKSEKFNHFIFNIIGGYTREHEHEKITGATYYAVAAFIAVVFFSKMVAISCLLFLTFGDAAASLVGTRWGRHNLFGKSAEGSSACFLVCSVVGWSLLTWIGLVGAAVATVIELVPLPVDDNLRIPVVSGAVMEILYILST